MKKVEEATKEKIIIKASTQFMDLKVLLWNARGIRNKKEEIIERIKNTDIAIITETKNRKKKNLRITGFRIIMNNTVERCKIEAGGIAIALKKDLQWTEIDGVQNPSENLKLLGIKIKNFEKTMNIVAIYRRPGNRKERSMEKNIKPDKTGPDRYNNNSRKF